MGFPCHHYSIYLITSTSLHLHYSPEPNKCVLLKLYFPLFGRSPLSLYLPLRPLHSTNKHLYINNLNKLPQITNMAIDHSTFSLMHFSTPTTWAQQNKVSHAILKITHTLISTPPTSSLPPSKSQNTKQTSPKPLVSPSRSLSPHKHHPTCPSSSETTFPLHSSNTQLPPRLSPHLTWSILHNLRPSFLVPCLCFSCTLFLTLQRRYQARLY